MIVIIDYGMGNVGSIANMLKKIGVNATISSDIDVIEKAQKIILPGVGSFDKGMQELKDRGLVPILDRKAVAEKIPIMGLCLGMQLFTNSSEEGILKGLGWIDAETIKFRFEREQTNLKIPHMGWNNVQIRNNLDLWKDLNLDARFYFVHSYHVICHNDQDVAATTFYGYEFASAIVRGNIVGIQFHPEKSHKYGMKLFHNFIDM
jgi:glutamine amidotransferase